MPEYLVTHIDSQSMTELQAFLNEHAGSEVTLRIQSAGGDLLPAIAASNAIARHGNVVALSDGQCASSATALAVSAKRSRGVSTCSFLLHSPHCAVSGDSEVMRQTAKALDVATDSLKAIYRTRIKDESRLEAAMSGDTWLSAQEAKDIGLIDELVASGDPQASAFSVGAGTDGLTPSPSGLVGNPALPSNQPLTGPLPVSASLPQTLATPTTHSPQGRLRAASDGLLIRAGVIKDQPNNPYRATRMDQLGTAIQAATGGFAQGVDTLPGILADSANRAMGVSFESAPEVWPALVGESGTIPVPDFRETTLAGLSIFGSAPEVGEHTELSVAPNLKDTSEVGSLNTYGMLFHLSRRALQDDSIGYFQSLAERLSHSVSRSIGDAAAAIVTTSTHGQNLKSGYSIFHSNHNNTIAEAPFSGSIQEAWSKLKLMKDAAGHTVAQPAIGIYCPVGMEVKMRALLDADKFVNEDFSSDATAPNLSKGLLGLDGVHADWRLDASHDGRAWYMYGPRQWALLVLEGQTTPMVDMRTLDTRDGYAWRVLYDARIMPTGYYRIVRGGV